MKTILTAATIAVLGTSSALAADLPARTYTKAPPMVAAPYSWTGFYLGANVGYGVGRSRTNFSDVGGGRFVGPTSYLSAAGAIGGGQIGYNWQTNLGFLGPVVFGLEADIQGSGQKGSACLVYCFADGTYAFNATQKIDWFGTVRGRVGVVNGPVLSYVTGGYAYGNVSTSGSLSGGGAPFVPYALSETRGGYVLGSGVEASLGGNWTGKLEYLYVDLGTQTQLVTTAGAPNIGPVGPFTVSSRVRDNIFRGGINYALNGNGNYVAPTANWAGFYVGGNAGSLLGRNRTVQSLSAPNFAGAVANGSNFNLMPDGYVGGAQIGYNWQSAAWVFGVEADFQGATSRDNRTCTAYCGNFIAGTVISAYDQKTPYLGTVRGRLGYSLGSTLFYGTAGFAYGQTKTTITTTAGNGTLIADIKSNKGGYAVGGGIESPFRLFGLIGPNWTVKSEYLFVDLGRTSVSYVNPVTITTDTVTSRTQEHIMRTGINYHFNTPVVAKY